MGMPAYSGSRRYTVAEVLEFPHDGKRYELIKGELFVSPAPRYRHQNVLGRLQLRLGLYLRSLGLEDMLIASPADISWDDETLVQPDLFVFDKKEIAGSWETKKTLLLAVEVLSPSSVRQDREVKRRLYQEHGVGTYWVVDPDARVVEVWTPSDMEPRRATEVLRWRVEPGAAELLVELAGVFRDPG